MVSLFRNVKDTQCIENFEILSYFEDVKTGRWQDIVLEVRTGKKEKAEAFGVTASGCFKERKAANIISHSGFICIDIDAKDQICTINTDELAADQYTYCIHKSISGKSYALYVKIDPKRHLDSFLGLEKYFFEQYNIIIDKACKDTSRLRFVSYDPDLYLNEKSKLFKSYLPKKEVKAQLYKPIVVKSDFDEMVNQAANMNLFDDYGDYIRLAFALSYEFGEAGRIYFHQLSRSSPKYNSDQADKDYTIACNRNGNGVTMGSVYFAFKNAGIKLTSEKTEKIKTIVKIADDPKEALISAGILDSEYLIEKFEDKNNDHTDIDRVIELIKMSNIRFNEITRNFEFNGVPSDDRVLAEFYQQVWKKINEDISKDKIWTLIQSRKNTTSYNPIRDFFTKNKDIETDNEFDKVVKCFKVDCVVVEDGREKVVTDYLDVYLKKWLLGVIGSAFGTYSLMVLVLIGEQGTRKTEFFRNLLPEELRKYYAESNLDEGKDSEILMCKKLLIMDDEFGGKSKKDALKLKRLSSQQTFSIRAPYGRISEDLNRIAVLCGTSNDMEIINDPTGNRRIIPVNIVSFDLDSFKKIDKKKLFIELYREWIENKEDWFLTPEEVNWLNKTTIKNTEVSIEEEILRKSTYDEFKTMTATDIKIAIEQMFSSAKVSTRKIGLSLKKYGFKQYIVNDEGKTSRVYKINLNLGV